MKNEKVQILGNFYMVINSKRVVEKKFLDYPFITSAADKRNLGFLENAYHFSYREGNAAADEGADYRNPGIGPV